jgi:hypothetical protein
MCAIDCFYVPFLGYPDLTVRSRCRTCGAEVYIRIQEQQVRGVDPEAVVLWDSDASYDCPRTNFFCTPEHLQEWLEKNPKEPGKACTIHRGLLRGQVAA